MNKIRNLKNKTSPESGLFNKFTKRYSSVVTSKLIRKSSSRHNRNSSPHKTASRSYDMTGIGLDEYKMEIGAPILISSTTIDTDHLDINAKPLRISPTANVTNISSEESENEVFADAMSSFQRFQEENNEEFVPVLPSKENNRKIIRDKQNKNEPIDKSINTTIGATTSVIYDVPKAKRSISLQKTRSKSAQNLHKSELRVYLQKAPSLELDLKLTTADLENCYDLPRIGDKKVEKFEKKLQLPPPSDPPPPPPPLTPPVPIIPPNETKFLAPPNIMSKSEPNTPICLDKTNLMIAHFKSVNSLQDQEESHDNDSSQKNSLFLSNISVNSGSQNSILFNSSVEDFDMKSASCQSLNAENLFLSIDELNEITREINESEEFNGQIYDYEYCEHRDGLKPSERRITLLKNKNARLANLYHNKEKLNNAWSGLKNWIGEERGRLKKAVQKHTASAQKANDSSNNVMGSKISINRTLSQKSCNQMNTEIHENSSVRDISSNLSTMKSSSERTIIGDTAITLDCVESLEKNNYHEIAPLSRSNKINDSWKGQNGFEELRRYIKQGGDFGKDLMGVLQERVDSEQLYAKSLSKMATKLHKACREIPGTVADAWRGVAAEMESRSETHRRFASSLIDEIVKPFKAILDTEHKTRKSVENNVDKSARLLSEWRISEAKAKKVSHAAARENEKLQDAMLDARIQKSPSIAILHHQNSLQTISNSGTSKTIAEKELKNAEKDCAKLDNKRRKAEETVKKADVEYYTLCLRAERARVDWEMSVLRGSSTLQNLENIRLINMKNYLGTYLRLISDMNPVLERIVQQLTPHVNSSNIQKDINIVKNIRKASEGPSEQLLPDFYCEHTTLAMNRERRKHALIKLLQLVKADLERERRSRNGLKGLSQKLNTIDSQSIADKLYHIRSMLMYLEGARFKLHSALLELDHKPRNSHLLAPHIQVTRDRTGLQQSILKVPLWLKNNDKMNGECIDNEYDLESRVDTNCIDIKNEILIKNYDKSYIRSKSSSEIIRFSGQQSTEQQMQKQQKQIIIRNNPKAQTLPIKDIDSNSPGFDRGIADGGSNQPDSDFDEFSSQDENDDDDDGDNNRGSISSLQHNKDLTDSNCDDNVTKTTITTQITKSNKKPIVISRCKALYSYTPKLYDELELNPGDIIEVHAKQEDGWWLGALNNQIGIFPATYVEEFI